jgi:hypothetical protein
LIIKSWIAGFSAYGYAILVMEYDILRNYCTNIHLFLQLIGYIARCFCEKKYHDEVNDGASNTILKLAAVATLLLLDDLRELWRIYGRE